MSFKKEGGYFYFIFLPIKVHEFEEAFWVFLVFFSYPKSRCALNKFENEYFAELTAYSKLEINHNHESATKKSKQI